MVPGTASDTKLYRQVVHQPVESLDVGSNHIRIAKSGLVLEVYPVSKCGGIGKECGTYFIRVVASRTERRDSCILLGLGPMEYLLIFLRIGQSTG